MFFCKACLIENSTYKWVFVMIIYMLFDSSICQNMVLVTCLEYMFPLSQKNTLVDSGSPIKTELGGKNTTFDCLESADDALHYVAIFCLPNYTRQF